MHPSAFSYRLLLVMGWAGLLGMGCARAPGSPRLALPPCQVGAPSPVAENAPPAPAIAFRAAPAAEPGDGPCREVPYEPSAGPRLFYVSSPGDGIASFVSDMPYRRGERFAAVRDADLDAPADRLANELTVVGLSKEAETYVIDAQFPEDRFAPSRIVGPMDGGETPLVGQRGDGFDPEQGPPGVPQLQYEVWLTQGVLQHVVVRCSHNVFVDQLWLVNDKRTCISSSLQALTHSRWTPDRP